MQLIARSGDGRDIEDAREIRDILLLFDFQHIADFGSIFLLSEVAKNFINCHISFNYSIDPRTSKWRWPVDRNSFKS